MKVIPCIQGDSVWFYERTGRVTASRVKDVVAILKNGKESAARATYKMELLTEILTGKPTEHFVTAAMQFGIETEPLARTVYEMHQGVEVERIGMVIHPRIDRGSASPDGLVGDDGLVEFKCPTTATHLRYLIDGVVPEDYIPQMTWQMACTGRKWCDFVSYDPRLPEEFNLFVVHFDRDDKAIAEMERAVETFIKELNAMAEKLLAHKVSNAIQAGHGPERAEIPAWETV